MKKLYYSLAALFLISAASCNDSVIVFESDETTVAATRATAAPDSYFWSGGERVWLDIDPTRLIVRFEDKQSMSSFISSVSSHSRSVTIPCVIQLPTRDPMAVIRQELVEDNRMFCQSDSANKTFAKTVHGSEVPFYLTGNILLRPKRGVSAESIMNRFEIDGKILDEWVTGEVIIRINRLDWVMDIANTIYTSGMVEWCHPDFATTITLNSYIPPDPYFHRQYYLRYPFGFDINMLPAWNITRGCCGIRVAVIDSGVEEHDDKAGRVLDGYTPFAPHSAGRPAAHRPSAILTAHGQAVAGIIAASHNDIGIAGVAPKVYIVPINIFYFTEGQMSERGLSTTEIQAAAINWAWNQGAADVINNSWGDDPFLESDILRTAIHNARTYGREGRGSVVVASSGNLHHLGHSVRSPANIDGVIAVGAIRRNGQVWDYSGRGLHLDLVAPSGDTGQGRVGDVSTTDRMREKGVVPGQNFRHNFGGTSAAAPQVAGVAALMLSVNPCLTECQVRRILIYTARQDFPGFTNSVIVNRPESRRWSRDVGYGLLNAYLAVRYAYRNEMPTPPPPPPPTINIPTITGPTFCCPGATVTFSILAQPAGVAIRWIADAPLSIQGANNQRTVTVRHTGTTTAINSRITVEVSWDGQVKHTVHRDVLVNRPVPHSIIAPTVVNVGDLIQYRVLFTAAEMQSHSASWWVQGTDYHILDRRPDMCKNMMIIRFMAAGDFTVRVTISNACGVYTRNINVTAVGYPSAWCPICYHRLDQWNNCPEGCFIPPWWWRNAEEEQLEE